MAKYGFARNDFTEQDLVSASDLVEIAEGAELEGDYSTWNRILNIASPETSASFYAVINATQGYALTQHYNSGKLYIADFAAMTITALGITATIPIAIYNSYSAAGKYVATRDETTRELIIFKNGSLVQRIARDNVDDTGFDDRISMSANGKYILLGYRTTYPNDYLRVYGGT